MRFFLIDRITSWHVGESGEAVKNVALSEDFFADHFPRRPVMPGVLILEGMAQLAGLLLEVSLSEKHGKDAKAVLSVLGRTKYRGMVGPGDSLVYKAKIVSLDEAGGKAAVKALRGDEVVADTSMVFGFREADDSRLSEIRDSLLQTWIGESPNDA